MPIALILRAHTNALVLPHSLGMVFNAKVLLVPLKLLNWIVSILKELLFSVMPFFLFRVGIK